MHLCSNWNANLDKKSPKPTFLAITSYFLRTSNFWNIGQLNFTKLIFVVRPNLFWTHWESDSQLSTTIKPIPTNGSLCHPRLSLLSTLKLIYWTRWWPKNTVNSVVFLHRHSCSWLHHRYPKLTMSNIFTIIVIWYRNKKKIYGVWNLQYFLFKFK